MQEVLSSIKDVKILGVERPFVEQFCEPTHRMAVFQARGSVISEAPRYILEAIALGSMLVLILYLLFSRSGTLVDILPTLGIFAFTGLRLFPARCRRSTANSARSRCRNPRSMSSLTT